MKKIYALIVATFLAVGLNAQTSSQWTFDTFPAQQFTENYTQDGLTLHATSNGHMTIDENKKTVDDVKYEYRLKLSGAGNITDGYRLVSFDVSGPCSIYVVAVSGSSNASDRNLLITDGTTTYGDFTVDPKTAKSFTASYTGTGGTIYIYSGKSGINLYTIKVTYGTDGISTINASIADENAPFFNLSGQQVSKAYKGVVLQNGKKFIQK